MKVAAGSINYSPVAIQNCNIAINPMVGLFKKKKRKLSFEQIS